MLGWQVNQYIIMRIYIKVLGHNYVWSTKYTHTPLYMCVCGGGPISFWFIAFHILYLF